MAQAQPQPLVPSIAPPQPGFLLIAEKLPTPSESRCSCRGGAARSGGRDPGRGCPAGPGRALRGGRGDGNSASSGSSRGQHGAGTAAGRAGPRGGRGSAGVPPRPENPSPAVAALATMRQVGLPRRSDMLAAAAAPGGSGGARSRGRGPGWGCGWNRGWGWAQPAVRPRMRGGGTGRGLRPEGPERLDGSGRGSAGPRDAAAGLLSTVRSAGHPPAPAPCRGRWAACPRRSAAVPSAARGGVWGVRASISPRSGDTRRGRRSPGSQGPPRVPACGCCSELGWSWVGAVEALSAFALIPPLPWG